MLKMESVLEVQMSDINFLNKPGVQDYTIVDNENIQINKKSKKESENNKSKPNISQVGRYPF